MKYLGIESTIINYPIKVQKMPPCSSPISANHTHSQWSNGAHDSIPGEKIIHIDLRHLPAPEPMHRILETLETLPAGFCLRARTPCRPQPLIEILNDRGYHVNVTQDGDAWVQIFSSDDCTSC